jgi:hypothetical protein
VRIYFIIRQISGIRIEKNHWANVIVVSLRFSIIVFHVHAAKEPFGATACQGQKAQKTFFSISMRVNL